jgi:hypothetical protein
VLEYAHQLADPAITKAEWELAHFDAAAAFIKLILDVCLLGILGMVGASFRKAKSDPIEVAAMLFLSQISSLPARLVGLLAARLLVSFAERTLHIDHGQWPDIMFTETVLGMVLAALFLSRRSMERSS